MPFGSIGMTVFTVDLYFATRGLPLAATRRRRTFLGAGPHWRVLVDLFLLAVFAGFYSVPLYALIQTRCEATHKAPHHRRQQHPQLAVPDPRGRASARLVLGLLA